VVGVDPSQTMHRHASERNADAIRDGRIVLMEGTADALPLPDESVDAAMVIDNLHFWPDRRAGLAELRRVLRPASRVACAFSPPSGGPPGGITELFAGAGFEDITTRRAKGGFLLAAAAPR
jgi:ubiquinone/menaquinone biosynthesis C-methylase UbiE